MMQYIRQSTVSPSPDRPPHSRQPSESRASDYPSWLPSRPAPPHPRSTVHSAFDHYRDDPLPASPVSPEFGGRSSSSGHGHEHRRGHGRRATQRSVRIVGMPEDEEKLETASRREPTDTTRVGGFGPGQGHARAYSRGTPLPFSPTALSSSPLLATPRPRFNEANLHIELLRNPSPFMRILFWFNRFFSFAHIPLQTFFDFNAAFVLFQVADHPNPSSSGVRGSGRGWTFAFAAYIACYFLWIIVVVILYEVLYSFYRRWRTKRPYMLSIYLSAPAFNLASMVSYNYFSFLWHIRLGAFMGDDAHARDAVAETCYTLAQNWPSIVLLLPRASLSLALLLVFGSPNALVTALSNSGGSYRDSTYFRLDGSLSSYARGVLIANCAWAAWRTLVLLISLLGLWAMSGMACGGLCGPRFRWEEDRNEKFMHTDAAEEEADAIPWGWRECTRLRIQDAHDFCMTTRPSHPPKPKRAEEEEPFEGLDRVLAAVGFPQQPPPARRGVLSQDLFSLPPPPPLQGIGDILPPADLNRPSTDGSQPPIKSLPYPFNEYPTATGSSSGPPIPFPIPAPAALPRPSIDTGTGTGDITDMMTDEVVDTEDMDDEELDEEDEHDGPEVEDLDDDDDYDGGERSPAERTSGSMSSLGRPLPMANTTYPFSYGRPSRAASAATRTTATHSRPSQSASSHVGSGSHPSQRVDTESPRSNDYSSSSGSYNPRDSRGMPIPMPMAMPAPPRHPYPRARTRTSSQLLPEDLDTERARTLSAAPSMGSTSAGDPTPERVYEGSEHEVDLAESLDGSDYNSQTDAHDGVQLLSPGAVRQTRRSNGSRSNSHSSGVSASMASISAGIRSRTHSLIDSARSISELGELVRGARSQSQSGSGSGPSYGHSSPAASSRGGSGPSSSGGSSGVGTGPDHTFGVRTRFISQDSAMSAGSVTERLQPAVPPVPPLSQRSSPGAPSVASATQSLATARPLPPSPSVPITGPRPAATAAGAATPGAQGVSSANLSFVTAQTAEGTPESSPERKPQP